MRKKDIENLELDLFKVKLEQMAVKGELPWPENNETAEILDGDFEIKELPDSEINNYFQTVIKASIDRSIKSAHLKLKKAKLPFGRYVHSLRDNLRLSSANLALLLNKDKKYVDAIENGQLNPLKMPAYEVVNLMEVLRINFTTLINSTKMSLKINSFQTGPTYARARSKEILAEKNRGDIMSHAIDAIRAEISKKEVESSNNDVFDKKLADEIKTLLKERGGEDLLI